MGAERLSAPDHEVVVIGAGPGGIAAGVELKRAGVRDFVILERADEVGGMTAAQAVRALSEARRRGATCVAVRQDAHDAYDRRVYRHGAAMRYYLAELNAHVPTYYRDSQGDSTYIRPTGFFSARRAHHRFPFSDYDFDRLPA
ncbi:FAD-dependent oxidoreductase [Nocardia sp. NPDC059764]|uniref:FAD-dependent oxidoreductase n=1 Tax=Nocardia sp. NPDC059764 TaxID=3346939 RepID=UPI0036620253